MSIFIKQERTLLVIGFFTEETATTRYYAFIGFNQTLPTIGTEYNEVEEGEAIEGYTKWGDFNLNSKNSFENPYYILKDYPELLDNFTGNVEVILATFADNKYKVVETFEQTLNISNVFGTRVDLLSEYITCSSTLGLSDGAEIFDFVSSPVTPIVAPFTYGFGVHRVLDGDTENIIGKNLLTLTDLTCVKIGSYTQNDIGAEDIFKVGINETLQPNTKYTYILTVYYMVGKEVISAEYVLSNASFTTPSVVELDIKADKNDLYVAKNTDKIVVSQNSSETLNLPDTSFNETSTETNTYYISNLIIQTNKDILENADDIESLQNALLSLDVSEYAIIGKANITEDKLGTDYQNYLPTFNGTLKMRFDKRDLDTAPADLIIFEDATVEYNGEVHNISARVNTDVEEYASLADSAVFTYTYYKNNRPVASSNVKDAGTYIVSVEANVGSYSTVIKTAILTITPKELTYSGHIVDKEYDGTTVAYLSTEEVGGIVPGDDVRAVFTARYTQAMAGSAIICSVTAVLEGDDSDNYRINLSEQGFTGNVNKKQLTLAEGAFTVEPGTTNMPNREVEIAVDQTKVVGIVEGDKLIVNGVATYPVEVGACTVPVRFSLKSVQEPDSLIDYLNYEAPAQADVQTEILAVMNATLTPVYGLGEGTPSIKVEFSSPTFDFAAHPDIASPNEEGTVYQPTVEIVSYTNDVANTSLELFGINGEFRRLLDENNNVYIFNIKAVADAVASIDAVIKIKINHFTDITATVTDIKTSPSYYGLVYLPYDYIDDHNVSLYPSSLDAPAESYVSVLNTYDNMDDEVISIFLNSQCKAMDIAKIAERNITFSDSRTDWENAVALSNDDVNNYTFEEDAYGRLVVFTRKDWGIPSIWDTTGQFSQMSSYYLVEDPQTLNQTPKEFTINNVEYYALISNIRVIHSSPTYKIRFAQ